MDDVGRAFQKRLWVLPCFIQFAIGCACFTCGVVSVNVCARNNARVIQYGLDCVWVSTAEYFCNGTFCAFGEYDLQTNITCQINHSGKDDSDPTRKLSRLVS